MTLLILLVAFLWAFAEATIFFLPADLAVAVGVVLLPARWPLIALEATVGSVAGGALLSALAAREDGRMRRLVTKLPGHSEPFLEETDAAFEEKGWLALVIGSFTGRPYKLYALLAGEKGLPFPAFLLTSALARALRFFPVAFLAFWVARHTAATHVKILVVATAAIVLAAWGVALLAARRTRPAVEEAPAAAGEAAAPADDAEHL